MAQWFLGLRGFISEVSASFLKQGLRLDGKAALGAALSGYLDRPRNILGLISGFATLTALRSESRFKWLFVAGLAVLLMPVFFKAFKTWWQRVRELELD